jgi:hypothetical protein
MHPSFLKVIGKAGLHHSEIEQLENDIRKAGTLVSARVYQTFLLRKTERSGLIVSDDNTE